MSRRTVAAAIALVVLAGTAAFVVWPRGADPVDRAAVLEDFRSRATDGHSDDADDGGPRETAHTADVERVTPTAGVYRFSMSGSEEVKLGVLPAEHRPYPSEISVVVVDGEEDDCFTTTLHLLEQHQEDSTYCVDADGGLRLAAHRKHQTVGPMTPTADLTCDPARLVDPDGATAPLTCRLQLSGGPAQLSATLTGTSTTRTSTVEVDGTTVDAIEVDVQLEVSGDLSGSWHEQTWFGTTDRLPLRVVRDLRLDGLATFTERSAAVLASSEPTT